MSYQINHDELNGRYIVESGGDSILIIKPYEKNGTWIGVEYDEMYDAEVTEKDVSKSYNDFINDVDLAIVFQTKDLPSMLRELAELMEGKA